MYWLPKLHKRPYKASFIANSSSCTTNEISKLLTSCLTAIKAKVIRGRTGLMVRASDSGSGDPGSILGRVGVFVSLSKGHLLPKSTGNTQE